MLSFLGVVEVVSTWDGSSSEPHEERQAAQAALATINNGITCQRFQVIPHPPLVSDGFQHDKPDCFYRKPSINPRAVFYGVAFSANAVGSIGLVFRAKLDGLNVRVTGFHNEFGTSFVIGNLDRIGGNYGGPGPAVHHIFQFLPFLDVGHSVE